MISRVRFWMAQHLSHKAVSNSIVAPLARIMFSPPPHGGQFSANPGSTGTSASRDRSRSPRRGPPAWTSGDSDLDAQFYAKGLDPKLLVEFARMPPADRRRIIRSVLDDPKENNDAWIAKCVSNFDEAQARKESTYTVRPVHSSSVSTPSSSTASSSTVVSPSRSEQAVSPMRPIVLDMDNPLIVQSMSVAWPDRSEFVHLFLESLEEGQYNFFMSMEPSVQCFFAWAFLLTAPDDREAQAHHVNAMIRRHMTIWPQAKAIAPPPQASPKPRVRVQMIFVGMSMMAAASVSATVINQVVLSHPDVDIDMLPTIVPKTGTRSDPIRSQDAMAAFGVQLDSSAMSSNSVRIDLLSKVDALKQSNTKFLVVCVIQPVITQGVYPLNAMTAGDLHAVCNNYIWETMGLIDGLRQAFGDEGIADLLLTPRMGNNEVISSLWGHMISAMPRPSQVSVAATPTVFGTPSNARVLSTVTDNSSVNEKIDEELGPEPSRIVIENAQDGVRPTLLWRVLNVRQYNERPLSQSETTMLMSIRCSTEEATKMPSRGWWLRWLTTNERVSGQILNEKMPCHGLILNTTGRPPRNKTPGVTPRGSGMCGVQRYCVNCEDALKLLDFNYNETFMADTVLAMLGNVMPSWSNSPGARPLNWGRPPNPDRQHQCGVQCQRIHG